MDGWDELVRWTVERGIASSRIEDILEGVAQRLLALGYPLFQASISMPSIDPSQRGFSIAWSRSNGIKIDVQGHTSEAREHFQRSPISYLLAQGLRQGRWKLPQDNLGESLDLLTQLTGLGATDYALQLVDFPSGTALRGLGFSIASDRPHGFSDQAIADLETIVPALALACYRIAFTRIAIDILAVYTGPRTSARILSGQTQRGEGEAIFAAILLADLKNFTTLNENFPPADIVEWLNEHFEAIGRPIEKHGGEILKFMGDSLLAIFPADAGNPAEACGRALTAARKAISSNDDLNSRRIDTGEPSLSVDIALHVGEIFYGNVGSVNRLDFTVIGKAVNEAARIEKLCDNVGKSLLASERFALNSSEQFELLGTFPLQGVDVPLEIYTLH